MPKWRWPAEWHGVYTDPVVLLELALYGHPDAGGCWERHCNGVCRKCDFMPVPDWPSSFYHSGLKLLLVIYVDDLKLAGPPDPNRI